MMIKITYQEYDAFVASLAGPACIMIHDGDVDMVVASPTAVTPTDGEAAPSTVQIAYHGGNNSNYQLRQKAIRLASKSLLGYRPDGDGWEDIWEEVDLFAKNRDRMKLRGSRKQKAARMYVPKTSITLVPVLTRQSPEAVAKAMEPTPIDVRIKELEDQIKALLSAS